MERVRLVRNKKMLKVDFGFIWIIYFPFQVCPSSSIVSSFPVPQIYLDGSCTWKHSMLTCLAVLDKLLTFDALQTCLDTLGMHFIFCILFFEKAEGWDFCFSVGRFLQMQLALLNIEHILFGPKNTVRLMSMMERLDVVAVSEWR